MRCLFLPLSLCGLFFFSACSKSEVKALLFSSQCMTEDGLATWTGTCKFGRAEGEGTATYKDFYIPSITGKMVDGVPTGIVKVNYERDDYYIGTLLNGEYHGYGLNMYSWGEGYEGNWVEGFRHGKGVYIHADGRRTLGIWRKGQLVRSWHVDARTGCKFNWAPYYGPVGEATWSGDCSNGIAEGAGTISWSSSDQGAPISSHITFTGKLVGGMLRGEGIWIQVDTYRNVVKEKTIEAHWRNGEINGFGREVKISTFTDKRNLAKITRSYEGLYDLGKFSGDGQSDEVTTYTNGNKAILMRQGQFSDNFLHGTGRETQEFSYADGYTRHTESVGQFKKNQFLEHRDFM